jgi:DNA transposition AAA+ family ATPase
VSDTLDLTTYLQSIVPRRLVDLRSSFGEEGLPERFKPTSAFRLVVERVLYAREIKAPLALITGAHGAGKSTALRYVAHREDILFWECKPGYKDKHVLADIAQKLGISVGQGWEMRTSVTAEQLAAAPRTFALDEAQRLDYNCLDLLKYLADQSGSTFILSSSPSLEKRIDRWPDIASRCNVRLRVSTMSAEEFVELYQSDGFRPEVLVELHRLSNGVMRVLQALLRECDEHLRTFNMRTGSEKRRSDLEPGHVRVIGDKVVG